MWYDRVEPVPIAARSEVSALIAWTLRSWVGVPLKAWMLVLVYSSSRSSSSSLVTLSSMLYSLVTESVVKLTSNHQVEYESSTNLSETSACFNDNTRAISQKVVMFILAAVRTWGLTWYSRFVIFTGEEYSYCLLTTACNRHISQSFLQLVTGPQQCLRLYIMESLRQKRHYKNNEILELILQACVM
jgi:hypothetical protein